MKITITKNSFLREHFFMFSFKDKSQSTFYIVYSVKYLTLPTLSILESYIKIEIELNIYFQT